MTPEEKKYELIRSAVSVLSEHFGAVQIVASELLPDGRTLGYRLGSGDFYARRALCQEFVEMDQASTMALKINEDKE